MITAILIGFHYSTNCLPTVTLDLYRAHRYLIGLTDDIIYITDMKPIIYPTNLIELSESAEIGGDLADFLETEKTKRASSKDDLIKAIGNGDNTRVFIYFSGHGIDGNILLPDGSQLSPSDFRSILTKAYPDASFFIVTDCCSATGLALPYRLDSDRFKLTSSSIFSVNKMLLITSSSVEEKAVSDSTGSYFTKYLFFLLTQIRDKKRKAGLTDLIKDIDKSIKDNKSGYKQTVSLYSSYPFLPILWSWLWLKIDVDLLELLSCLKVTTV